MNRKGAQYTMEFKDESTCEDKAIVRFNFDGIILSLDEIATENQIGETFSCARCKSVYSRQGLLNEHLKHSKCGRLYLGQRKLERGIRKRSGASSSKRRKMLKERRISCVACAPCADERPAKPEQKLAHRSCRNCGCKRMAEEERSGL